MSGTKGSNEGMLIPLEEAVYKASFVINKDAINSWRCAK